MSNQSGVPLSYAKNLKVSHNFEKARIWKSLAGDLISVYYLYWELVEE